VSDQSGEIKRVPPPITPRKKKNEVQISPSEKVSSYAKYIIIYYVVIKDHKSFKVIHVHNYILTYLRTICVCTSI